MLADNTSVQKLKLTIAWPFSLCGIQNGGSEDARTTPDTLWSKFNTGFGQIGHCFGLKLHWHPASFKALCLCMFNILLRSTDSQILSADDELCLFQLIVWAKLHGIYLQALPTPGPPLRDNQHIHTFSLTHSHVQKGGGRELNGPLRPRRFPC